MKKFVALISIAALVAVASTVANPAGAKPTGYTAFTCKEGAGLANTNAHCDPKSSGNFGHEAIGINQEVQLKLDGLGKQVFKTVIAGAAVTLEAEGFECFNCMVENVEEEGEKMQMKSLRGYLKFSNVSVASSPTKCQVVSGAIQTEAMKYASTASGTVSFAPLSGTTIAKFEIAAKSGQTCAPAGSYTMSGSWAMTPSGATWKSNVTAAEKVITVGPNAASFTGEATAICFVTPSPETPETERNPIALTGS